MLEDGHQLAHDTDALKLVLEEGLGHTVFELQFPRDHLAIKQ